MRVKQLLTGLIILLAVISAEAQTVTAKLEQQVRVLLKDPTMKHAAFSLSVLDAATGKPVYQFNEQMGLAPASTLKVLTAIAALTELGPKASIQTTIGYTGTIREGVLNGNLVLRGGGDPSLGSWRYGGTREELVIQRWVDLVKKAGITAITGDILVDESNWPVEPVPDGWIWEDIGNYYGAGVRALNWRENQYDLYLASGTTAGAPVKILRTQPQLPGIELQSFVTTGARGSGDNAYIYLPPGATNGFVKGTIPPGENGFVISGSMPDPSKVLTETFAKALASAGVDLVKTGGFESRESHPSASDFKVLGTEQSPPMDSLVHWFLKKSINLYGEAMIRQLAIKAGKEPSGSKGVEQLIAFWKQRGIEAGALQIMDGSGLSPQNRVTAHALASALYWAQKQPWYNAFYQGLPVYNGMRIKSGSIGGARAYAGYHKAADGRTYVLAIMVNNYTGSGSAAVKKLYSVLDVLK
ncbi:MAG TPA: D-alanyl-D-alanine carboxypeptidase/D-alanyl-D-alanine-endopeptidase [Flavihumibacter sp.]